MGYYIKGLYTYSSGYHLWVYNIHYLELTVSKFLDMLRLMAKES